MSLIIAANHIVRAESSKILAYAAVISAVLREGKQHEKGYATQLRKRLAGALAEQRAGLGWATMGTDAQMTMVGKAEATAKRYADKSVAVAAVAAERGLPLAAVLDAIPTVEGKGAKRVEKSAEETAAEAVYAWLLSHGVTTQEDLYAFVGAASNNSKAQQARSAGAVQTEPGDGGEGGDESPSDKGNNGETVKDAVVGHISAAIRAAGADLPRFAGAFTAALADMPEAERRALAKLILGPVQAAAELVTEAEAEKAAAAPVAIAA